MHLKVRFKKSSFLLLKIKIHFPQFSKQLNLISLFVFYKMCYKQPILDHIWLTQRLFQVEFQQKLKKNQKIFFVLFNLEKNKNIFRKTKYVIPHQIFWRIRICFQNEKIFTMPGVISWLRLKAKIGKYAYYKPIFFLEDEDKIFSKISKQGNFLC